jgi:hypothetical protein
MLPVSKHSSLLRVDGTEKWFYKDSSQSDVCTANVEIDVGVEDAQLLLKTFLNIFPLRH